LRKAAAQNLIEKMRRHSSDLTDQAILVSDELIRIAIFWYEQWYDAIEEASKCYFGQSDIKGMFNILYPLHKKLQTPESASEILFDQMYGQDLREALLHCKTYQKFKNEKELQLAWDIYYGVFKKISKQVKSTKKSDIKFSSKRLYEAENLILAVPGKKPFKKGTYKPNDDNIIRISKFENLITIMTTQKRPRKITILASNGVKYPYLLKGNEDIRLDERVMQLFGLVNTSLLNEYETNRKELNIIRFNVIPLSSNAGLIGWVEDTDTFHQLIVEYRGSKNISIEHEYDILKESSPDYDNLNVIQKVEVFEHVLEKAHSTDIYDILWLKSKNSEVWLEKRINYSKSLAVMSIVGYIMGLGDRHPSNLSNFYLI
jgi:serine/threonine-protein kinase mTOR